MPEQVLKPGQVRTQPTPGHGGTNEIRSCRYDRLQRSGAYKWIVFVLEIGPPTGDGDPEGTYEWWTPVQGGCWSYNEVGMQVWQSPEPMWKKVD